MSARTPMAPLLSRPLPIDQVAIGLYSSHYGHTDIRTPTDRIAH